MMGTNVLITNPTCCMQETLPSSCLWSPFLPGSRRRYFYRNASSELSRTPYQPIIMIEFNFLPLSRFSDTKAKIKILILSRVELRTPHFTLLLTNSSRIGLCSFGARRKSRFLVLGAEKRRFFGATKKKKMPPIGHPPKPIFYLTAY